MQFVASGRAGQRWPDRHLPRPARCRCSAIDGRADPRPDVREDEPVLGNMDADFDFSQAQRPPVLLATNPPADSPSIPAYFTGQPPCIGCTTPPPALTPARPGPARTGPSRRS